METKNKEQNVQDAKISLVEEPENKERNKSHSSAADGVLLSSTYRNG
ncbi:hypothetical protein [Desulfitobacterium sp.]|nr:hypothetical protein [Desulfitobacterium sp.]MEA4903046.1 hypothetical protein [Desulfitobacterium sp.]